MQLNTILKLIRRLLRFFVESRYAPLITEEATINMHQQRTFHYLYPINTQLVNSLIDPLRNYSYFKFYLREITFYFQADKSCTPNGNDDIYAANGPSCFGFTYCVANRCHEVWLCSNTNFTKRHRPVSKSFCPWPQQNVITAVLLWRVQHLGVIIIITII